MVRFKNRYLLCAVDFETLNDEQVLRISSREIINTVRHSLSTNFGELASGQSSSALAIKLWSPALRVCLIRASRDHFRTVWAATTLVTSVLLGGRNQSAVRFSVVHVGGTIRSCQKSATEYAREFILNERRKNRDASKLQVAAASVRREIDAMEV